MNYRIEEKGKIRLVGVKKFISPADVVPQKIIPEWWDEMPLGTYTELKRLSDSEPSGVVGLFADKHDRGFDYWFAASTTKACPEHLETIEIPPSTWAIFEVIGPMPDAVQETFRLIYAEWFPGSDYERIQIPEIEWFSDGDSKSEDFRCEVWVPVVRKKQ